MKIYKCLQVGPGGLKCPCCNHVHAGRSLKYTKRINNRKFRRNIKVSDLKEYN